MCSRRCLSCLPIGIAALLLLLALLFAGLYLLVGPSPACGGLRLGALSPGTSARKLLSGGRERCYLLYLPAGLDSTRPVPVVVSLHGFASNAMSQELLAQWNGIADEEGFAVVYPEGTSFPLRWNSGGALFSREVDDVRFLRDVVTDLANVVAVDPARIYVTGMSNGGAMANRIACEAADIVAAAGTVAAVPMEASQPCIPQRTVPLIAFHGTGDPVVKYEGGAHQMPAPARRINVRGVPFSYPPVETWIADWAERDGCSPTPEVIPATGDTRGIRYTGCQGEAEVVLYTIEGGGHTWPGGLAVPYLGKTSRDINASAVMWAFFRAHPMPDTR
jgi:polyhydroxybutyrate depolymerase